MTTYWKITGKVQSSIFKVVIKTSQFSIIPVKFLGLSKTSQNETNEAIYATSSMLVITYIINTDQLVVSLIMCLFHSVFKLKIYVMKKGFLVVQFSIIWDFLERVLTIGVMRLDWLESNLHFCGNNQQLLSKDRDKKRNSFLNFLNENEKFNDNLYLKICRRTICWKTANTFSRPIGR